MSDPSQSRLLAERLLSASFLGLEDLLGINTAVGRYQVLRPLGEGAFGRVYLAHDPELDRQVAVKVLTGAVGERLERFLTERRVVAALKHPNIVEVFDAGTQDGEPFLVMEFVDGPTLAEAKLDLREAARTMQQVALACHHAHEAGVIHHDLKPTNVLLGDRPVVADFGVAKVVEDPSRTRTGQVVGTPTYMAPEQIEGVRDDRRTDVYALGAILYRLVTGVDPYEGFSQMAVLAQVAEGPPPTPRSVVATIPAELEAIVLRAMARKPVDRYATALDLGFALSAWLKQPSPSPSSRRLVAAGAAALLAVGGLVFAAIRPAGTHAPARPVVTKPPGVDAPPVVSPAERLEECLGDLQRWERGPAGAELKALEGIHATLSMIRAELTPPSARRAELGLARIEFQRGFAEKCQARLQASSGDDAEATRLQVRLAWLEVLLGKGRRSEAWPTVARSLAGASSLEGGEAALLRGQRLLLDGSLEAARSALEAAEAERGTQVEALITRALTYRPTKGAGPSDVELGATLRPALDAIALSPANLSAYRALMGLARSGFWQPRKLTRLDFSAHLPALRRGLEARPSAVPVMTALGFALSLEGYRRSEVDQDPDPHLQEGIRVLEDARRVAPNDGLPPLLLVLSYGTRARHDRRSGRSPSEAGRLAKAALADAERLDRGSGHAKRFRGLLDKLLKGGRQ